jgi:hypothetical protein
VTVLTACGGNNSKKASPTAAQVVTRSTPTTSAPDTTGRVATPGGPATAQTVTPQRTPQAGPSVGCVATNQSPPAAAAPATPEPPFAPGPQPTRPEVDLSTFTVDPRSIPAGFKAVEADPKVPVRVSAQDIASSAANPQTTLSHLTNIGFLGGRQQAWAASPVQNRIPSIYVLHLVFGNDAGASDFLRNPPLAATICARPESGPQLGQETLHLFYTYETPGGAGPADGHALYWRCGRVVLGVNNSNAPAQASQGLVDDLGRKVLADFTRAQPCS